jgi:ribosomal protein S18 acetylase RimI-like enzyme
VTTRLRAVRGELNLRRIEAADFDAWFDLFEQVAAEGRWIGQELPVDRAYARKGFDRVLANAHSARFVAEIDGELVGEIFVEVLGGRGDLGMMVGDGFRGCGVGSALMEACIAFCREAGAHKVTLTTWPHNERGLGLYRKFGFVVEGRLVRHYRRTTGEFWDAIPMGLVLDEASPGSSFDDAPNL